MRQIENVLKLIAITDRLQLFPNDVQAAVTGTMRKSVVIEIVSGDSRFYGGAGRFGNVSKGAHTDEVVRCN